MRTQVHRTVLPFSVLTLLILLGCGDGLTDPPPDPAFESQAPQLATVDPQGVEGSATGSAHVGRPDGSVNTITFNALKKADGSVTGQLLLQNRFLGTRLKMEVDCLAVDGNVAVMSGTVSQFTFPQWVGAGVWFVVEDNGEGAGDPPDRATGVYGTQDFLPHPEYCQELMADFEARVPPPGALVGWEPLVRGNIQVRGG